MATPTPEPVVRAELLAAVRAQLSRRHRLVLTGPAGVGKSTLVAQLPPHGDGELVLSAYPPGPDTPFGTLADLFASVDPALLADLPAPRRDAVAALLRLTEPPADGPDPIGLRLALRELTEKLAHRYRLWFVLDPADRADAASLDLLTGLWRQLPGERSRVLLATRETGFAVRVADLGAHQIDIPLWNPTEIRELLAPLRLPHRQVSQVCRGGGGLPKLAARLGALAAGSSAGPRTPPSTVAADLLAALSPRAQQTLLVAAAAIDPTEALLRRAGRDTAHRDLVEAARLGLIELDEDGTVTLHAEVIRDALVATASARAVRRIHRILAALVTDPVAADRHRGLAATGPQAELAERLDATVALAQRRGDVNLTAELAFLAADLTPATDTATMTRRLLAACRHAASAGRVGWAERAAAAVCELTPDPNDRLRARMAVIDAVGQDFGKVKELFTTAETEARAAAGTDPGRYAELLLWMAWRTYVCDTDLTAVLSLSRRAAELAERGGDAVTRMQALTMTARIRRMLGLPDVTDTLRLAETLVSTPVRDIPGSAQFAQARHELFDDRLDRARDRFASLLPAAEQQGELKGHIEVLRGLAEVELRAGHCAAARDHIGRAVDLLSGSDLSPSPALYVAALVETHTGNAEPAARLARQGLESARQDDDKVFTIRNLYVLGLLRLYASEPEPAARLLAEAAQLDERFGTVDPSILPLHGDLAEALVQSGRVDEALAVLTGTRETANRLHRSNVLPRLDLAEAVCHIAVADHQSAARLLERARTGFDHYGLVIERGRTLLAQASLERRRRRRARARELVTEAVGLYTDCGAAPWRRRAEAALARLEHHGATPPQDLAELTPGENRVVRLVADGATNRQVASRLDVSVKTVEASLTRIYRKLGVQSRVQLSRYRGHD